MKKFKGVFVIALALLFFMVCGEASAESGGPGGFGGNAKTCNGSKCSISLRKVQVGETLLVDPEILTLDEYNSIFAVEVSTENEGYGLDGVFNFEIFKVDDEDIPVDGFVPVSRSGNLKVGKKSNRYYVNYVNADGDFELGTELKTIGYIVVYSDSEINVGDFAITYLDSDYTSYATTDVIINGIVYSESDAYDCVNTDIYFGDFRFNYVLFTQTYYEDEYNTSKGSSGYWESVNNNSNKVIVDNENSLIPINGAFEYFAENDKIVLSVADAHSTEFYENNQGIGDMAPQSLSDGFSFTVEQGEKNNFEFYLDGGKTDDVKEILKNDGKIGHLSLWLSTDMKSSDYE